VIPVVFLIFSVIVFSIVSIIVFVFSVIVALLSHCCVIVARIVPVMDSGIF